MKIVNGFVTNSSSTSFVINKKSKLTEKSFLAYFGVTSQNDLYELFLNAYNAIKSRLEIVPPNVDIESYFKEKDIDIGDDIKEIKNRYERGEEVYIGRVHSDGENGAEAELFLSNQKFVIIADDFYFNNDV